MLTADLVCSKRIPFAPQLIPFAHSGSRVLRADTFRSTADPVCSQRISYANSGSLSLHSGSRMRKADPFRSTADPVCSQRIPFAPQGIPYPHSGSRVKGVNFDTSKNRIPFVTRSRFLRDVTNGIPFSEVSNLAPLIRDF